MSQTFFYKLQALQEQYGQLQNEFVQLQEDQKQKYICHGRWIPIKSNIYTLGSEHQRWSELYVHHGIDFSSSGLELNCQGIPGWRIDADGNWYYRDRLRIRSDGIWCGEVEDKNFLQKGQQQNMNHRNGLPGPMGPTGPSGEIGIPGIPGNHGQTGPMGINGEPGDSIVGPMGPTGPKGDIGYPGACGKDGIPGTIGPRGLNGLIGPPGRCWCEEIEKEERQQFGCWLSAQYQKYKNEKVL